MFFPRPLANVIQLNALVVSATASKNAIGAYLTASRLKNQLSHIDATCRCIQVRQLLARPCPNSAVTFFHSTGVQLF
jgi:hypothetical protein